MSLPDRRTVVMHAEPFLERPGERENLPLFEESAMKGHIAGDRVRLSLRIVGNRARASGRALVEAGAQADSRVSGIVHGHQQIEGTVGRSEESVHVAVDAVELMHQMPPEALGLQVVDG